MMKNAPPATTTVPATEAQPVQQKNKVEDEKDVPDPETDPKMPNIPEAIRKNEQEEAAATKACMNSYFAPSRTIITVVSQ